MVIQIGSHLVVTHFKEHRLFLLVLNASIRLHALAWRHVLSQFLCSSLILRLHINSTISHNEMSSHQLSLCWLYGSHRWVYSIVWLHKSACYNQFLLAKYRGMTTYQCHCIYFACLFSTHSFILTLNNLCYLFLFSTVQYDYMHSRDVMFCLNFTVLL